MFGRAGRRRILGVLGCLLVAVGLGACGQHADTIAPPQITVGPQSAAIAEGGTATFAVAAVGEGTLAYQWQRDGTDLPGANRATYTTDPETFSSSGAQIRVRVSNDGGEVLSNAATLTVTAVCTGAKPNTGWCRVGPAPIAPRDVDPLSADIAWAIAGRGGTSRTLDGGTSWTAMGAPPRVMGSDPQLIRAVDASIVWVANIRPAVLGVGLVTFVFRTADAGKTWTPDVDMPAWFVGSLDELRPVGADAAWVRNGSRAFKTLDGAVSWSELNRALRHLAPVSASVVWALPALTGTSGSNVVLISIDGGSSWLERTVPMPATGAIRAIAALDDQTAWAVGDGGAIFKTADRGVSWASQASGTAMSLTSARALDAMTVWAAGTITADGKAAAVRTIDGGTTWSPVEVFGRAARLRPVSASAAWGGDDTFAARTLDGGARWIARASSAQFDGVALADKRTAWVSSQASSLLRTVDAGASWQLLEAYSYFDRRLAAVGNNMLWTAIRGQPMSTVAVTRDATRSWSGTQVIGNVFDIAALDAQTAWVGGEYLYRSDDGGVSWVSQGPGPNGSPLRLSAVNSSVVWAAGHTTTGVGCQTAHDPPEICTPVVLKTVDGGSTWKRVLELDPKLGIPWFSGVAAANERTAWVVGAQGMILKTIDGGASWTAQASNTTRHLVAVAAADADTAWVIGEGSIILSTVDGGATWVAQPSGTDAPLTEVAASDRRTAWVAGADGTLLKTTTGGN